MSERICFTHATILAGDELQVIPAGSLLVQSGRIVMPGETIAEDVQRVDMSGKLLCPMFIDAHTHVADTGAKELGVGLPLEQVINPPDGLKHRFLQSVQGTQEHIAMMRSGLGEMLANGIIAAGDFREQGLEGVRALRQAAQGLPIQVLALGRMAEAAGPLEIEREAHAILAEADGLGVRDVEAYPPALLQRLRKAYPHKLLAAHAAEDYSSELRSRSQTGIGQAERLLDWQPDFLVHLTHTRVEEIDRMVAQRVAVVACPRSNGILGDGLPPLAEWARRGLRFALGTDNVMFTAPDMFREMDYASRMVRGLERDAAALDPHAILSAATISGARTLHLDRDLGSLAPGKRACFIAFDLHTPNLTYQKDVISAVVHRATSADIAGIYIDGNLWQGQAKS